MKLYDVQKRAEAGGAIPRQPPPTRPTRPCLCTLIVLSLLIVLTLAVTLTLLLTGPDWLRLNYSSDNKLTETILKAGSLKASGDKSPSDEPKPGTSNKDVTKASTTESPLRSVVPTLTPSSPTTKFWFKEVIFFKPRPVKTSTTETKATETATTDQSDKSARASSPTQVPVVKQFVVTKSASSGDEKDDTKKKIKTVSVRHLFSGLWPDVNKMLSEADRKTLPFLSMLFPKTKTNQTRSNEDSASVYQITPAPSFEGSTRASPVPTPASVPTTQTSPENPPTSADPRTEGTGRHATTPHGLRVRRVPTWIFAHGNAAAFAHANSGARTSNGGGLGSGSYVRTYNRARNGVARSWTVKDETRDGVKTHSSSDTGVVRLPEQRTTRGLRLVYDGATGTWRYAKLPDTSATYTPPVVATRDAWTPPTWAPVTVPTWAPRTIPTPSPWGFRSPAATGSWGAYGNSQSASPHSGATSDVFAAARRRLEAAKRRMRQHRQNMGGFTGYTNWG